LSYSVNLFTTDYFINYALYRYIVPSGFAYFINNDKNTSSRNSYFAVITILMFYVAGVSHAHAESRRDNKRIIGKPILNVDHFQPSQTGSSFIL